jgi:pyruvate dehydrogenase E1 component alpha subunit
MNRNTRKDLFRSMLRIRLVEERIATLYGEQEMRCPTHFSIGQEAVAAGVIAHLDRADYVMSAHRSHAHYIAKGGSLKGMLAELYGKATGCAAGKGGSMHLIDKSVGFLGCVPIVGSTMPIGVGASFGDRLQGRAGLTVIFFGDGATETGVFHESLNFAAIHKLPVVFVCENNLYSVCTPLDARQPAERTIAQLAAGHGIPTWRGDGQEVEGVFETSGPLIEHARRGDGPVFLEYLTYRWLEHCGPLPDLHLNYRPSGEFDAWQARDPLRLHREALLAEGSIDEAEIADMTAAISAEIDEAVAFGRSSPFPARDQLDVYVYAN